jgi:hypothetical protein
MDRNQTKICPGKKFVTNEYPDIYIYTYISIWRFLQMGVPPNPFYFEMFHEINHRAIGVPPF